MKKDIYTKCRLQIRDISRLHNVVCSEIKLEVRGMQKWLIGFFSSCGNRCRLTREHYKISPEPEGDQLYDVINNNVMLFQMITVLSLNNVTVSRSSLDKIISNTRISSLDIVNCSFKVVNPLSKLLVGLSLKEVRIINCGLLEIFPDGANADQLAVLDLTSNRIYGNINKIFIKLKHLNTVILKENCFSGLLHTVSFPRTLHVLDVSRNVISGNLPNSITELDNLKVLNVGYNYLFGEISFELITFLSQLEELTIFEGNELVVASQMLPPTHEPYVDNIEYTSFPTNSPTVVVAAISPSVLSTEPNVEFHHSVIFLKHIPIVQKYALLFFVSLASISLLLSFIFFDKNLLWRR